MIINTQRSQQEILDRIEFLGDCGRDVSGYMRSDLYDALTFENAAPFLAHGVTKEQWNAESKTPAQEIESYMPFAFGKANGCRALSAERSLLHMGAWLWLDGKDRLSDSMQEYDWYGKPQLAVISEMYGIDWRALDDGEWVVNQFDILGLSEERIQQEIERARSA